MIGTLSRACPGCGGPTEESASVVWVADLAFHDRCLPTCRGCGRRRAAGEDDWVYEARVEVGREGYELWPAGYLCANCLDAIYPDGPAALD